MPLMDLLDQLAAGLRTALVILAVLILKTGVQLSPDVPEATRLQTLKQNGGAWALIALAVLALSPLRALTLLHHPVLRVVTRFGEISATGLSCLAFIRVLVSRAQLSGASAGRVAAGQRLLFGVVALSVVAVGVVR